MLVVESVVSRRSGPDAGARAPLEPPASWATMVAETVRRLRGRLVRAASGTTVATFGTALAATLCATEIVEASRDLGLEVRAGLHAGACDGPGTDADVSRIGSRIGALGRAGQILMSQTVTSLLIGSGLGYRPYGRRELPGVAGTWDVWQLQDATRAVA